MIIGSKNQLLKDGRYQYLQCKHTPEYSHRILIQNQTNQLYKITQFQSSAIFRNNSLINNKFITITSFNPTFLLISKLFNTSHQTNQTKFSQIQNLIDLQNQKYFMNSIQQICEVITSANQKFYKPSQTKILDFFEKRYSFLLKSIQKNQINIKQQGLQKINELPKINSIILDILREDINEHYIKKLVCDRLKLAQPKKIIIKQHFISQSKETLYQKPERQPKKIKPKESKKDQSLKKEAGSINKNVMMNFFKSNKN